MRDVAWFLRLRPRPMVPAGGVVCECLQLVATVCRGAPATADAVATQVFADNGDDDNVGVVPVLIQWLTQPHVVGCVEDQLPPNPLGQHTGLGTIDNITAGVLRNLGVLMAAQCESTCAAISTACLARLATNADDAAGQVLSALLTHCMLHSPAVAATAAAACCRIVTDDLARVLPRQQSGAHATAYHGAYVEVCGEDVDLEAQQGVGANVVPQCKLVKSSDEYAVRPLTTVLRRSTKDGAATTAAMPGSRLSGGRSALAGIPPPGADLLDSRAEASAHRSSCPSGPFDLLAVPTSMQKGRHFAMWATLALPRRACVANVEVAVNVYHPDANARSIPVPVTVLVTGSNGLVLTMLGHTETRVASAPRHSTNGGCAVVIVPISVATACDELTIKVLVPEPYMVRFPRLSTKLQPLHVNVSSTFSPPPVRVPTRVHGLLRALWRATEVRAGLCCACLRWLSPHAW